MDVACSTFCFASLPLEQSLRRIAELEFTKADLGVAEKGGSLTPTEIVADTPEVLARIRRGPTMGIAGVTARLTSTGETLFQEVESAAHLAKQLATAVLTIDASPIDTSFADEIERLQPCLRACKRHGVLLSLATRKGTLTQSVETTVELCSKLGDLGVTLDPSCYIHEGPPEASWDALYPFVRQVVLRDTGRDSSRFQVSVGRGEIDYSKVILSLQQNGYRGSLVVNFEEQYGGDLDIEAEARRLGRVLESIL